jgi:hypothetical protein
MLPMPSSIKAVERKLADLQKRVAKLESDVKRIKKRAAAKRGLPKRARPPKIARPQKLIRPNTAARETEAARVLAAAEAVRQLSKNQNDT